MSNRVRFYPYKVTYIDLHDFMAIPNGQNMPVITEVIRAKSASDAKSILRAKTSRTIAIASASRHPENLGICGGVQYTVLTQKQLKALEREVHSGAAQIPHHIDPKAFVTNNPNSTIHTRTTPAASPAVQWAARHQWPPVNANPVGAPRTALKSTPIPLSTSVLDVGGFTVGYKRPGEDLPVAPTVARTTPQPDIYNMGATTLVSLVDSAVGAAGVAPALDKPEPVSAPLDTLVEDKPVDPPILAEDFLRSMHSQSTGRLHRDFKYKPVVSVVTVDSNTVDKQVSDTLKTKASIASAASTKAPRPAWKFWVPFVAALAGIAYGMAKAWR